MKLTLFDLDGTLLPTDSDHAFGDFVISLGWADAAEHKRRNDQFFADYQAGRLDMTAYVDFASAPWRDRSPRELDEAMHRFLREVMQPQLHPAAVALVQQHQAADDLIAIVTATNDFITRPIADLFGVTTLIATELARDERGRATGAIQGVAAYREGKVARVQQWLQTQHRGLGDFARSRFYSDSTNDLPLLEHVSHPVATNPAPDLEAVATARGWPIIRLFA